MPGYTTLESLPGTETKKPLTIGYHQNVHFTSREQNKKHDLFSCPECEEDFGTKSLLEKNKKKYHVKLVKSVLVVITKVMSAILMKSTTKHMIGN